jgi:hypothetical protein
VQSFRNMDPHFLVPAFLHLHEHLLQRRPSPECS